MTETLDTRAGPTATMKGRSYAETRSAVLDLIRSSGGISRVGLARRSALAEATISKIVKELITEGLVVESGFAESTGGKRPVLLRLNDVGVCALGVTMDFHRCVVVLCGLDGTELARREAPGTGRDDPPIALDRLATAVVDLLESEQVDRSSIIGLGVATGGRRGSPLGWVVDASFVDVWESYPVEEELAARTGLSVLHENDANCAALREFWTSQEPDRDFVTVYMSHGIGAGIVLNGTIYRGSSGNAGEIGHTIVDPDGLPCWCGARGCLETVASPRALVDAVLADRVLRKALSIEKTTRPLRSTAGSWPTRRRGTSRPGGRWTRLNDTSPPLSATSSTPSTSIWSCSPARASPEWGRTTSRRSRGTSTRRRSCASSIRSPCASRRTVGHCGSGGGVGRHVSTVHTTGRRRLKPSGHGLNFLTELLLCRALGPYAHEEHCRWPRCGRWHIPTDGEDNAVSDFGARRWPPWPGQWWSHWLSPRAVGRKPRATTADRPPRGR